MTEEELKDYFKKAVEDVSSALEEDPAQVAHGFANAPDGRYILMGYILGNTKIRQRKKILDTSTSVHSKLLNEIANELKQKGE
jgi:hypothetical protein